jgi:dolichol-phosphate mannosyltransferase
LGIGSAHRAAIEFAYKNSIDVLVTLDADLTHSPEHIPQLLELLSSAEVVIASRFIGNGGLSDWNFNRKVTTHLGHLLTKILLQVPYDSSGAFRAYRISKIPVVLLSIIQSSGYSFFFESIKILEMNKIRITEMPVVLPSRTYGHSKMKTQDILKSVSFMISLSIRSIFKSDGLKILTEQK